MVSFRKKSKFKLAELEHLKLLREKRVIFFGSTGSGKTFLMAKLISLALIQEYFKKIFVVNSEHEQIFKQLPIHELLPRFRTKKELQDQVGLLLRGTNVDGFSKEPILYVVDELWRLSDKAKIHVPELEFLSLAGRKRNRVLWSATQRPQQIHNDFIGNSEIKVVLRLDKVDFDYFDRKIHPIRNLDFSNFGAYLIFENEIFKMQ